MGQKVSILVHPFFFAYHMYYCNGERKKAERECKRLGKRYKEGIRYAHDGLFVFLKGTEGFEYEEKLIRYAQTHIPRESVCIANSHEEAEGFLVRTVTGDDAEIFMFGEDIGACVAKNAARYHDLLNVKTPVAIIGNYCGTYVPNFESAWQQVQAFSRESEDPITRTKVKVTWF